MLEFFGVSQDELGCRYIAVGGMAAMSADRSPIEVRSLCNKLFDVGQIRHVRMVAPPGEIGARRVHHLFQYPLRRETPTAMPASRSEDPVRRTTMVEVVVIPFKQGDYGSVHIVKTSVLKTIHIVLQLQLNPI